MTILAQSGRFALAAAVGFLASASAAIVAPASAQQISRDAYSHPARNKSFAAQVQVQERMLDQAASSGMGALHQYVTNYTTSSTSVGNLNEINMILGDGANGTVTNNGSQDNSGDSTSDAQMDVDVSTQITELLQGNQGGNGNPHGNHNGDPHSHHDSSQNGDPGGNPNGAPQ